MFILNLKSVMISKLQSQTHKISSGTSGRHSKESWEWGEGLWASPQSSNHHLLGRNAAIHRGEWLNSQEFWGTQPEPGLARAKWHLAICVLSYKSIFILHSPPQYIWAGFNVKECLQFFHFSLLGQTSAPRHALGFFCGWGALMHIAMWSWSSGKLRRWLLLFSG